MAEKLVNSAWRIVVLAMIAGSALGSLALVYHGVLLGLKLQWSASIPQLICGLLAGLGVWLLCRHRNDLVCD